MSAFEFSHPCGIKVGPALKETVIKEAIDATSEIKVRDMNTGWIWYDLPIVITADKHMRMSLAFFSGVLCEIQLADTNSSLYGSSWNDWSESREKLRAKNTEGWLNELSFSIGSYSWGQIWAGYDAKGGFGHAIIRYKT